MWTSLESTLKYLGTCKCLDALRKVHAQLFLNGLHTDNYLAVKLVTICGYTLGNIGYARSVFDSLVSLANVYLWTTIISLYSNHHSELRCQSLLLFRTMHQKGSSPNNYTLSAVVKACSFLKAIGEGNQLHAHATKLGFNRSLYVEASLLDMYVKSGMLQEAEQLFKNISKGNIVACNSMISCYVKEGDIVSARQIFEKMSEKDSVSLTIMLSGFVDVGDMLSARQLFDETLTRGLNSWNTLLAGYSHCGDWYEAMRLFLLMCSECVDPNHVTMAILMSACGQSGSLQVSKQIHAFLLRSHIEMNEYVLNSLVDMYSKCGAVSEAYNLFSDMPVRDVVSYNVMIGSFASHACEEDALKLFPKLLEEDLQPDNITFLGILTACSHAGLVDLGVRYFDSMRVDDKLEPSVHHYACMVDLFGRGGYVQEAYKLVKSMPTEAHAGVWGALLNACRISSDTDIAEIATLELLKIEPENAGNYLLLSNIYAGTHSWDAAAKLRRLMRGTGVHKTAGCSWVEVDNKLYEFLVGDEAYFLSEELYAISRHL